MDLLLGVALVLGVMILVHELGHFIAARLFGVRVDVFSIGFGPRLFGWKRGATDYRVSALPLGTLGLTWDQPRPSTLPMTRTKRYLTSLSCEACCTH